jgi:hypothetical protein
MTDSVLQGGINVPFLEVKKIFDKQFTTPQTQSRIRKGFRKRRTEAAVAFQIRHLRRLKVGNKTFG